MSEYTAVVSWKFSGTDYLKGKYSREHAWVFDGALLHESSRTRTMPTDRILTDRCDMTLVGRTRSSD